MKSSYKSKRRHESAYETTDGDFKKQIKNEVVKQTKETSKVFWEQLFDSNITSEGQTSENIVFDLSKLKVSENESLAGEAAEKSTRRKTKAEKRPGIDYHGQYVESITRFSENASSHEVMQENGKIQQIMAEIKKLVMSSKSLQAEVKGITVVSEVPANPGKYYVNFFEWMLIMVRQARQKVEDSKSWLATVKGKKSKRMGYWGMAKKHGTSFSLSNERSVSTSTG